MKTITLVKQHSCTQLAHLYEHLFLRQVNDFFYRERLFKSLDYYAHGTTTEEGGVIIVEVGAYSLEAAKHLDKLKELSVEYGVENSHISTALLQIIAEEPWQLIVSNKEAILTELKELELQPWQLIDQIDHISTAHTSTTQEPIYLSDTPQSAPSDITLTLAPKADIKDIERPLFNIISRILLMSASNHISNIYGFYAHNLFGTPSPLSVTSTLATAPSTLEDMDVNKISKEVLTRIHSVLNENLSQRIHESLRQIDYSRQLEDAPSIERTLQETGVLIGTETWRSTGTVRTIDRLIRNISLEVRIDDTSIIIDITP